MAIKTICDKCKCDAPPNERDRTACVKIGHGEMRNLGTWYEYDLCEKCFQSVLEFIVAHPAAEKE